MFSAIIIKEKGENMKKKILSFVLALCLIIPTTFALSACGNPPTNLTKTQYAQAFEGVTTNFNNYINTQPAGALALPTVNETELVQLDRQSQMARMTTACVQFVGFLKNLCDNETFEITPDYQQIQVIDDTYPSHIENFKIKIKMSYNTETSLITSEVFVEDDSYVSYLVFDILFDFETETLEYFTISGYMGSGPISNSNVNYFMFQNNTLKMLPQTSTSFTTFATAVIQELNTLNSIEWNDNLPDYSEEYLSAMQNNQ